MPDRQATLEMRDRLLEVDSLVELIGKLEARNASVEPLRELRLSAVQMLKQVEALLLCKGSEE